MATDVAGSSAQGVIDREALIAEAASLFEQGMQALKASDDGRVQIGGGAGIRCPPRETSTTISFF